MKSHRNGGNDQLHIDRRTLLGTVAATVLAGVPGLAATEASKAGIDAAKWTPARAQIGRAHV